MYKNKEWFVLVCHKCSQIQWRIDNNGANCNIDGHDCLAWKNCNHFIGDICDHHPPAQFDMEAKKSAPNAAVTPPTEADKSWAATPKKGVDGMASVNSYDVLVYEEINDGAGNITRNNLVNASGILAETSEAAIAAACLIADVKLTPKAIVKVKTRGF
jgi:hypothetical protein